MSKENQAKQLPKKPVQLDQFHQIEVKLTPVEEQLLVDTERRKAMLINNISAMFAEQLQHTVAVYAKKKNIQFSDELFAGVFYDAPKKKAYILQFKSQEDADLARQQIAQQGR